MNEPDVSVVVPCFAVGSELSDQIRALAAQQFPGRFEVVLSDNGGNDDLRSRAAALSSSTALDIRMVDATDVRGVSHARNIGLRASRAPLVAICDADDEVSPQWLASLVEAAADHALVGGAIDTVRLNSEVTRAWRPGPAQDALPRKLDHLPYAMGCNLVVHRERALAIGGWREDYVAGGDDVDFAWRMQKAGASPGFAPAAVVHYRYRDDLRATAKQMYAYARCDALLLRDYRADGARPKRLRDTIRELHWLVGRARDLRGPTGPRGRWLCRAAAVVGRAAGSIKHRQWAG